MFTLCFLVCFGFECTSIIFPLGTRSRSIGDVCYAELAPCSTVCRRSLQCIAVWQQASVPSWPTTFKMSNGVRRHNVRELGLLESPRRITVRPASVDAAQPLPLLRLVAQLQASKRVPQPISFCARLRSVRCTNLQLCEVTEICFQTAGLQYCSSSVSTTVDVRSRHVLRHKVARALKVGACEVLRIQPISSGSQRAGMLKILWLSTLGRGAAFSAALSAPQLPYIERCPANSACLVSSFSYEVLRI